jgi:dienelactone hydrolase
MTRREWLQLSAACTLSPGLNTTLALAQEPAKAKSADEMIHAYLVAEEKKLRARFMDGAKTKEEWEKARPRLKREFLEMLGLDPLPEKTPLKATVTGSIERSGVTIEKVHYQSKAGLYVTGNLYLPKIAGEKKKHPAILYVCGHSGRGRDGNKTAFQDHGLWFATNGYVCLVVDTLQLGEIAGIHHGTYGIRGTNPVETRFWWHSRGYTPAGVECWNGIRGIDYLLSRPEVDAEKIGVTGISGGGATTSWLMATDERVKVAVPVSGFSDLECYVTDEVINGHCDCMFAHNTYRWEWTTILALFAPKPMLFANSDNDKIFPMTGNRRISERLRQCYKMLGAPQNFDDFVSKGGHDYRPDLRLAVFNFFQKHLKKDDLKITDADFPKIDGKELRVFATDDDLPKDSINARADETFVPVAKVEVPAAGKFKEWKAGLVKQLREKCFRALPEKVPGAIGLPRPSRFMTELGIELVGPVVQNRTPLSGPKFTFVVLNPDEGIVQPELPPTVAKLAGSSWVYLTTRGVDGNQWTRKNPPNTMERSLVLIGQTADSGRVRDVAASLSGRRIHFDQLKVDPIGMKLLGRRQAGIIAAYAALFVPDSVEEIIIFDPPLSHRDGPHFLNVLRVLDIPEALGLLAPEVKLTLIGKNAKDKAFDKTAAIYERAGAKEKFRRE